MKAQGNLLILLLFTVTALTLSSAKHLSAATPVSATCDRLYVDNGGSQATDSRMWEGGLSATLTKLQINGCNGQEVPIDLYAVDLSGTEVFLSEQIAKPNYENCTWNKFTMFIPATRFATVKPSRNYTIYIRSPNNYQAFITKWIFTFPQPAQIRSIWSVETWSEDAGEAGNLGFQMKTQLRVVGQKGKTMKAVVILEDVEGKVLVSANRSPLIVDQFDLTPPYDDAIWKDQTLFVPYKILSDFYPNSVVVARPGVRLNNGKLIGGAMYVRFLSGGSTNTVYNKLAKMSDEVKQMAKRTEDKLDALSAPRGSNNN